MQSPPKETVLLVGYLAALNLLRDAGDPDGDTWSEQTRGVVDRLGDAGPLVFTAALLASAEGFRRHILKERSVIDCTMRLLDGLRR